MTPKSNGNVDDDSCCFDAARCRTRDSMLFGEHVCPVECITKAFLFIVVTVVFMSMPLGEVNCEEAGCNRQEQRSGTTTIICCLCDTYRMLTTLAEITNTYLQLLLCVLMDIVHEVKLQFYYMLEMLDHGDLCRSVCCKQDDEHLQDKRSCRCPRSRTSCKLR